MSPHGRPKGRTQRVQFEGTSVSPIPRDNNAAELQAFDTTCRRLSGFDEGIHFEFVDGFLTALAAGPRVPPVEEWLSALCGDAFERAFADPTDHAQALKSLRTRLVVLQDQLDAEALFDEPDRLRLMPMMVEWTDEDRAALVAEDKASAEEAAELLTGAEWVEGFLHAVRAFPALWVVPADDAAAEVFNELFAPIEALLLPEASDEFRLHIAEFYADAPGPPTRDDLINEACFAVQELRLWFVETAPVPATRRVEKAPGRNDPCPCGSGKKYKKCHAA
jgi:uncharacterized protein